MKIVFSFFAALAAIGLMLSIASHAAALIGIPGPLGNFTPALQVGIFVVWFPAVLASNRLVKNYPRKDLWKAVLRGSPAWMKYMAYGFFWYALANFAFFLITAPKQGGGDFSMPPAVVRGFSGHWMAFYSAALAILYSASKVWDEDSDRRCPNGHEVLPLAKFCDQCGQPVQYFVRPQNKL